MRKILTILLLISSVAFAGIITWTSPTEREDGTPLALNEIASYTMYCGAVQGAYISEFIFSDTTINNVDASALGFGVGTQYCVMTTTDTEDRESGYSNEFSVVTVRELSLPKPPNIPPNMVINVTLPAL